MSTDVSLLMFVFWLYGIEMGLDSIHTPQFGLTYILFCASSAGDEVDQVSIFACNVFMYNVTSNHTRTSDLVWKQYLFSE